jgi:murein L,D-transpeptidase YafK
VLTLTALLLAAGAAIAILIHYERAIPPLLADQLPKADSVLVEKAQRRLSLIRNNQIYRSYTVSLGREPVGHKQREGDLRTPEGRYMLDWRNPDSCCYKSLHVSYPNEQDKRLASERGDDPGGLIMIHGQESGWGWLGWLGPYLYKTHGCIAVRNTHMEEIWNAVADGTPIEIRP